LTEGAEWCDLGADAAPGPATPHFGRRGVQ
jgi:hypothetical protein